MNDSPDQQATDSYEKNLAGLRERKPNAGNFFREAVVAITAGNLPRLQALMEYAQTDAVITPQAREILNRPVNYKSTLILTALQTKRDGNPLPVEEREEMLGLLMAAGAVPKKSVKGEDPIALMAKEGFSRDFLQEVNDYMLPTLGLKPGDTLFALKSVLASRGKPAAKHASRETPMQHASPKPDIRRPAQLTGNGGGREL